MGLSPQEYLMQYRMDKAHDLLLESDVSVQEIALRVGYENALTFSKNLQELLRSQPCTLPAEKPAYGGNARLSG